MQFDHNQAQNHYGHGTLFPVGGSFCSTPEHNYHNHHHNHHHNRQFPVHHPVYHNHNLTLHQRQNLIDHTRNADLLGSTGISSGSHSGHLNHLSQSNFMVDDGGKIYQQLGGQLVTVDYLDSDGNVYASEVIPTNYINWQNIDGGGVDKYGHAQSHHSQGCVMNWNAVPQTFAPPVPHANVHSNTSSFPGINSSKGGITSGR